MQAGGAAAGSSSGAGSNTARASVSFRISIFVENLVVEIPKVTVRFPEYDTLATNVHTINHKLDNKLHTASILFSSSD